jgi:RimJ/RimL family protein N-acetyltransferase
MHTHAPNLAVISPELFDRVSGWLAAPENYRWLDFGNGIKPLHPASLRLMLQRDIHCLRAVVDAETNRPIGLVALSNISPEAKTATLWYVLGEKAFSGRGYLSQAVSGMLQIAFEELKLNSVTAWCAASNGPSRRILEKNGLQPMGRQRECHPIDGGLDDRLWYDMLSHDYFALVRRNERLTRQAVA